MELIVSLHPSFRILRLSNFGLEFVLQKEFCDQVKNRYNSVYHRRHLESNPSLSVQRQRAEIVQRLSDTIFFTVDG